MGNRHLLNHSVQKTCAFCKNDFATEPLAFGAKYCSVECHFWHFVKKDEGCWSWNGWKSKRGYGSFFHGRGNSIQAHRLSFELHKGKIPQGLLVCHHCDNPECTNPDHLFIGTHADNTDDMIRKGRKIIGKVYSGSDHANSLLLEDQVRAILVSTKNVQELADEYGVKKGTIENIIYRRGWKHLDAPKPPRRRKGPPPDPTKPRSRHRLKVSG